MKVSFVTTSLGDRGPYLRRLFKQFVSTRVCEWVVCGPSELARTCLEIGAIHVPFDGVIGTARNLCAERATGDILVHLDDDDWQHQARIEKQIAVLTRPMPGDKQFWPELVGTSWLYCLVAAKKTATRISYWDTNYVLPGATMAYHRESWRACPFADSMAEDGPFSGFFLKRGSAVDMRDPKLLIYMRGHGRESHHVKDWWEESRHKLHTRSALEVMRHRIEKPYERLRWEETPGDREAALAHEEESSTVYVRHLMGEHDFEWFCAPL